MDVTLGAENHDLDRDWRAVLAQTRRDETGIMTLPLTGYGLDPARPVLETHPEAALAIAQQLADEEPAYWDMLEAAMAEGFAEVAAALRP